MKRPVDELTVDKLAEHCTFVAEAWRRFPDAAPPEEPVERPDSEALNRDPLAALRRYRQLASIHILWRDLSGQADIRATGQALSQLARDCLELALEVAESNIAERHGRLVDNQDAPLGLTVLGLGKLGGDELNFNSDIDVVFARDGQGRSTGPRRIDAADWNRRVARELIRLVDTLTAHGRVWIVDTRLRPFGDAGALVWSLTAMEEYFLSEGRTWERYAWLKAACVAGDHGTGERLLEALEPFIYRRYLDYGIFESLRELHARIDANSRAGARHDDIKRGSGGIRELEFLVQSLQILRGGRETLLRRQGFLPALEACTALGLIEAGHARQLHDSYCFLRILENRLQAMTARQGHALPDDDQQRARLAWLMGCESWRELEEELDSHRQLVRGQFEQRFRDPDSSRPSSHPLWPPDARDENALEQAGFQSPDEAAASLDQLHGAISRRPISAEGRQRLDRLMPRLLDEICSHDPPDTGLDELLRLIDQISRRSAYLSLLYERPETLTRLVRVFRISARVAEWIINSPQLLDDLLDPIHGFELPVAPSPDPQDHEGSLWALARWRQAGFLRTALAELDGRLSASEAGKQLSFMAGIIVDRVLELLGGEDEELAVIAYGNLGAGQLHYASDLDLVFLHRGGKAPLRTVQRLISAMQMPLPGGRLFEIDTRLRPNGRAGLLVSRIESFEDYQHNHAWTWEHQALVRARWIAGDRSLKDDFDDIRRAVLTRPRECPAVAADLALMRRRQRTERKESPTRTLLTDIQFLAELGILCRAAGEPALVEHRCSADQLRALAEHDWIEDNRAGELIECWQELLARRHHGWLMRTFDRSGTEGMQSVIERAWREHFPTDPERSRQP